ncbi:MAG: hypothetical protein ACSLE8_06120 [Rhodococcus sp. (in: high G+C Gram-positive bacteria)]
MTYATRSPIVSNPSQLTILEASHGYLTEVPLGMHVERCHWGEDGPGFLLVTDREFNLNRQQGDFFGMQSWFVDEFLDMAELECPDND